MAFKVRKAESSHCSSHWLQLISTALVTRSGIVKEDQIGDKWASKIATIENKSKCIGKIDKSV